MNKERHIYIGITITLVMTLTMTLLLFAQFDNNTWREVATAFIFPFIYTIAGAIIVAAVGTIIANKVLKNYNERLSYGLSERAIQLLGYRDFSDRIQDDLRRSALTQNRIIQDQTSVSREADLVVVSLDLNWYNGSRKGVDEDTEKKLNRAEQDLTKIINGSSELSVGDRVLSGGCG